MKKLLIIIGILLASLAAMGQRTVISSGQTTASFIDSVNTSFTRLSDSVSVAYDTLTAHNTRILNAAGDVAKVGTPANNEVAVWTGDGTLEGESEVTYSSNFLDITAATAAGLTMSGNGGTNTATIYAGSNDMFISTDDALILTPARILTGSSAPGDVFWTVNDYNETYLYPFQINGRNSVSYDLFMIDSAGSIYAPHLTGSGTGTSIVRYNRSTGQFTYADDGGASGTFDSTSYTYTMIPTTVPTPAEGMQYYNDTQNKLLLYNGSSWDTLNMTLTELDARYLKLTDTTAFEDIIGFGLGWDAVNDSIYVDTTEIATQYDLTQVVGVDATVAGSGLSYDAVNDSLDLGGVITKNTYLDNDTEDLQFRLRTTFNSGSGQISLVNGSVGLSSYPTSDFSGTSYSYINSISTQSAMGFSDAGTLKSFAIGGTTMLVSDPADLTGLQYNADYSTNGEAVTNDRWLPDLAYVKSQISDSLSNLLATGDVVDSVSLTSIAPVLTDPKVLYQFGAGVGFAADTALFDTIASATDGVKYGRMYIPEDSVEISYLQASIPSGDTLDVVFYYNDTAYVKGAGATIIDTVAITGGDSQIATTGFSTTTIPEGNYVCVEFFGTTDGQNPTRLNLDLVGYIKRD